MYELSIAINTFTANLSKKLKLTVLLTYKTLQCFYECQSYFIYS